MKTSDSGVCSCSPKGTRHTDLRLRVRDTIRMSRRHSPLKQTWAGWPTNKMPHHCRGDFEQVREFAEKLASRRIAPLTQPVTEPGFISYRAELPSFPP